MPKPATPSVCVLSAALIASACAGGPARSAVPAPSPATQAATGDTTPRRTASAADVEFLQHMLHHHAQALVMTALVPERSTRPDIRRLAERIEVSQRDEIAQMQRSLRERGATVPAVDTMPEAAHVAHGAHATDPAHAGMAGMLTGAELARLAAARGPAFDRLFLELMIRHHAGALTMVSDLMARGGAQESSMYALASEIESDQRMEIARMQRLLAASPPG